MNSKKQKWVRRLRLVALLILMPALLWWPSIGKSIETLPFRVLENASALVERAQAPVAQPDKQSGNQSGDNNANRRTPENGVGLAGSDKQGVGADEAKGQEQNNEKAELNPDKLAISQEQAALVGIEVAPLSGKTKRQGIVFPAHVVIPPNQISVVSAPFAAQIESIAVQGEQSVSRGALLARLESPVLIRAQSEFLQAVDQERFLQETLAREESLTSDRIVSLKQLQATRNEHVQATAAVAERRQVLRDYGMSEETIEALSSTRVLDSKTVATAPIDGVVLEILIAPGQRVEAQAPLFKVGQLAPLWLELQVPVRHTARFSPGIPVRIPEYGVSGRVVVVGSSVDATTQMVTVRAEVAEGTTALRPGQFLEVLVELPINGEGTWTVPPEAIIRRGKEAFLFVKTADGFRAQMISVEEETPDAAVVRGPFRGDEVIAVRGLVALKGAWQGLGGSD
jgi:RND family efflux transporter MFP subunit